MLIEDHQSIEADEELLELRRENVLLKEQLRRKSTSSNYQYPEETITIATAVKLPSNSDCPLFNDDLFITRLTHVPPIIK